MKGQMCTVLTSLKEPHSSQVASPAQIQGGEKNRESGQRERIWVKPSSFPLSLLVFPAFCRFSNLLSEPSRQDASEQLPPVGALA